MFLAIEQGISNSTFLIRSEGVRIWVEEILLPSVLANHQKMVGKAYGLPQFFSVFCFFFLLEEQIGRAHV